MSPSRQRKIDADVPWSYQRQSLIDRSLSRMACAASGHRWWRVIDARVCGRCGTVER